MYTRSTSLDTKLEVVFPTELNCLADILGISRLDNGICKTLDSAIVDL
jgi:hypothetical protein